MTKKCADCRYAYYDTSNKGNWYCTKHNTHYRADEYCGYFEPK